ncbi:MAG TPA: glycosyltransferase [Acidimicrobiia bacterium]|jgi:glycosyltransferase involved in cell wall biosynthesis|nr:glycosyltransferase [Acidimicrobiia bacterium]
MIRLLSVQPVAERGGSDHLLVRMLRSLPSDEFDRHVALPGRSPLAEEFAAAGATLHSVPMERLSTSHGAGEWAGYAAGWPVAVGRLVRLIRRLRIDVVHSNSLHSLYGWAAAAITRRPHVWHAREIVVQSRAALRLERFLARHFAVKVVCMSQAIADQLDPANVEVVYETVDPADFRPELAGRFRDGVGIPDAVPLVGSVGRIDTWKGFDVLLDAFERAKGRRPDLHLVVAGAPVTGKEQLAIDLATRATQLADVHWLGPRTDTPELFADLDLFVLPSTEPEPYGIVVVEALASGAPVVVTDAGGAPEIVARAAPGSGTTVPPGNAGALADAVVRIAPVTTDGANRRGRPALQPPADTGRVAEIFREAAEGGHGPS